MPRPLQRRLALWLGRRPARIQPETPIVSFTFDDFPRSALLRGGEILREYGFFGTYYAAFGLMGKTIPTGEIFSREDIPGFIRQQHEMACHTFDHCDSWETPPREFEASILRNQEATRRELSGIKLRSLSYPISSPRPQTKRRVARHYGCARGGGQTFNRGKTDLNYLKAFFIEQSRDDFALIARNIDDNSRANGWLIFATHDVCDSPTRFGCTPALFHKIVNHVAQSGALVLPVAQALQRAASHSVSWGREVRKHAI